MGNCIKPAINSLSIRGRYRIAPQRHHQDWYKVGELPFKITNIRYFWQQVASLGREYVTERELKYCFAKQAFTEGWKEDWIWEQDSAVMNLFNNYLPQNNGDGQISVRGLMCAAILLCDGKPRDKAKVFYEIFNFFRYLNP